MTGPKTNPPTNPDPDLVDEMEWPEDENPVVLLDRSTLERYSICPRQGRYADEDGHGMASDAMASGQEVHEAFRRVMDRYLDASGQGVQLSPKDLSDEMLVQIRAARPDQQSNAIDSARFALWTWSKYMAELSPLRVLRYDGGPGQATGQIAIDIDRPGYTARCTLELDLLTGTESPEELEIRDYKSGWKQFTSTEVGMSFQFQMQAALVFENYPDCQLVRVRVINTRSGRWSGGVEFRRDPHVENFRAKLFETLTAYEAAKAVPPAAAAAWPTGEKCRICPAILTCSAPIDTPLKLLADDPGAFLRATVAMEEQLAERRKVMREHVKEFGDIYDMEGGVAFGYEKPPSARRPTATTYDIPGGSEGEGDGDG